jgi:hypothetical protein
MIKLHQLVQSATSIKFPTGAFGKTCMLVAIFVLACAAIAWSARDRYVSGLALVFATAFAGYAVKRLFDFADKHPSAAILEGSQFVKHEQIQLAAKGHPNLTSDDATQTNEPENLPLIVDSSVADAPEIQSQNNAEESQ